MSRRDFTVRLRHMLDYAREALEMVRGRKREDLDADRKLNLALVRLLEIVGEAAAGVTPQERERFPAVPWQDIVGLRNQLIHGYDSVDFDILWAILQKDIPPLIAALEKIVPSEENS
ncbi:MAG: DUF86 domain-containing protein [Planctomycetota bacterium]|nr:MAG: DUF86 domain-containing protein [Planctomycetota bacterium]